MCDIFHGIKYCYDSQGYYIVGTDGDDPENAIEKLESTRVVIPQIVHGKKVQGVGQLAFFQNLHITEVVIYARILFIRDKAFCRMLNLVSINIPNTCQTFGLYVLDQYDFLTRTISIGTLNVYFEPKSQAQTLNIRTFAWKERVNIYICEKISPQFIGDSHFYQIKTLNIYSPESFTLYNYQTQHTDLCYSLP